MSLHDELVSRSQQFQKQWSQSAAAVRRKRRERIRQLADQILDGLPDRMRRAADKGRREFVIQRPVLTDVPHGPAGRMENNCRPEQLFDESEVVYRKCVEDFGLTVIIRHWQERDPDEPLAYHGGFEMVAIW